LGGQNPAGCRRHGRTWVGPPRPDPACWRLQTSRAGLSRRPYQLDLERALSPVSESIRSLSRLAGGTLRARSAARAQSRKWRHHPPESTSRPRRWFMRGPARGRLDPYRPPRPRDLPGQGPDRHPERPLRPVRQAPVPGRVSHFRCSLPRSGPASGPSVELCDQKGAASGKQLRCSGKLEPPSRPLVERAKPAYQVSFDLVVRCKT
jgi:hypothetical protein